MLRHQDRKSPTNVNTAQMTGQRTPKAGRPRGQLVVGGGRRKFDLTLWSKLLVYSRSVYAGCFESVLGFAEGGLSVRPWFDVSDRAGG